MQLFKYFVIIALLIFSLCLSKSYCKYIDNLIGTVKALYSFLLHTERRLGGYMTLPSKLADGYEDERISPMLDGLKSGLSPLEAYKKIGPKIPKGADAVAVEYFSDFGKGDLTFELSRLRNAVARLGAELNECTLEGDKQKKICAAALPSCALGVIILLI